MNSAQKMNPRDTSVDMEQVFKRFDADGDGKISVAELGELLKAFGSAVSPEEAARMMRHIDANGDAFLDMEEFARINQGGGAGGGAASKEGEEEDLKEAFALYDIDKNGLISARELHRVLTQLGEKVSVQDCYRMIGSVDSDGDGHVNFEEFKRMMNPSSSR